MSITITVPADTKTPGTAGHTSDHDLMSDALTTLGNSAANTGGDTFTGLLQAGAGVLLKDTVTPSAPSAGQAALYGNTGYLKVYAADGNRYATGKRREWLTTGIAAFSAGSLTTLADDTSGTLSVPVVAGTYSYRAVVSYKPAGTTGTPQFAVAVPTGANQGGTMAFLYTGQAAGLVQAWSGGSSGAKSGPTNALVTASNFCQVTIEGTGTFTATGSIAIQANANAGSNLAFLKGSFIEVCPVV